MKSFLFSLDAMVAIGLLLTMAVFITALGFTFSEPVTTYERFYYTGKDLLKVLKETKINDIQNLSVIQEYLNSSILGEEDLNKTVLDITGSFWAEGNKTYAGEIIGELFGTMLNGTNMGYEVLIDNESIYKNGSGSYSYLARLRAIVSGYSKGKPVEGYTARVYLNKLTKVTSKYAYFGGFVGEGNISRELNLPGLNTVLSAEMEMNAGGPFDLYINGNYSGNYTPSETNMTADRFTVCNQTYNPSYCSYFKEYNNTVEFVFTGNGSFIGGGYFKASYNSSEMITNENVTRYTFPGIEGFINLYSSFYVPGDLKGLDARLHFFNNYTMYLTIGNVTVFTDNSSSERTVNITNSTFSSLLNYQQLSRKTVPIRLGTEALVSTMGGNADVILITDISGSMSWRLDSNENGVKRDCDDPLLNDSSTKRISLAKCLDEHFIDIVLSTPNNRVGLVSYSGEPNNIGNSKVKTIQQTHDLSDDIVSLKNQINSYNPSGATGICGAIREAKTILEQQSGAERQKFIVVMSDGVANVQCDPTVQDETEGCIPKICPGTWWGCLWWPWICDDDYCYNVYGCLEQQCGDWVSETASDDAIDASCDAFTDINSTVYSIGFGPVSSCPIGNQTLQGIAGCGNGSYFTGTNATQLQEIYGRIAQEIVNVSYRAQLAEPTELFMGNILYPDSYIEFEYEPLSQPMEYGEISLALEGPRFGGNVTSPKNGSFFMPGDVRVLEAKVTSYSSEYWTDRLRINNTAVGNWTYIYRLWDYGDDYSILGDPYIIDIPADMVAVGEDNWLEIDTGLAPNETTGGSPDSGSVFTVAFKGYVDYSGVFPKSVGSDNRIWYDIDQDRQADGYTDLTVGSPDIFDPINDSIDDGFEKLLDKLNFIDDSGGNDGSYSNPIDVKIFDVKFSSGYIGNIPTLWGPAGLEIRVWM
jgi:hypothetical protein